MGRNIVICLDGTGNEFGNANSNVVKLYQMLDLTDPERQMAYYHPGLGTISAPNALTKLARWWTKTLGLAVGYGIIRNIEDAYLFLMRHARPGDRIFLFGFSRGAYTARALTGLLHMFGLLSKGNEELVRYATRMLRAPERKTWAVAARFKTTFSRKCPVHFVGVWDTVSSVGWIYDPLKIPYTAKNPDVGIGRHSLAIDERRCFFRQNLWAEPTQQDIKQVWFAGVHSDVGGSYPEQESGLAKIALSWMVQEAIAAGLQIDTAKWHEMFTGQGVAAPDAAAPMHNSLRHAAWLLLEIFPHRYYDTRYDPPRWRWRIPLARRRHIAQDALVHSSVPERMRRLPYRPPNLPSMTHTVP